MALPTVFETQDALNASIPEGMREHYTEQNGKWILTVDKVENIATGLAKNRDEFRTEKEKLAKQLTDLQLIFGDKKPEEVKALLDAEAKKQTDDLQKKGNFEEVLKKKELDFNQQLETLKAQITERDNRILSFTLTTRIEKAALEGGINPKQVHRVLNDTQKRFRLAENDKIEVLDADGYPVSITPEAFFKEVYKADEVNAIFYLPTGAGGGGAVSSASNGTNKKTVTRQAWEKMTPQESTSFFKDGGLVVD